MKFLKYIRLINLKNKKMGTGKADNTNNNNAEVDNHPEGTRLGHYTLGTYP